MHNLPNFDFDNRNQFNEKRNKRSKILKYIIEEKNIGKGKIKKKGNFRKISRTNEKRNTKKMCQKK